MVRPSFFRAQVRAATAALALTGLLSPGAGAEATPSFAFDIKPLLSNKCLRCHGPDDATRVAVRSLIASPAASRVIDLHNEAGEPPRPRMGLVVPGFIPSPLGEIIEYLPTWNETLVCLGIWAFGLFLYTLFLKMTIPVLTGDLRPEGAPPRPAAQHS